MSGRELSNNTMLVHLSLASCGLRRVDELNFPNLHVLDVKDNQLREVHLSEFRRQPLWRGCLCRSTRWCLCFLQPAISQR